MANSPAFSFYAKDFLTGAAPLSLAHRGAYITLLAWQWDGGAVPDDAAERARILGCSRREEAAAWARIVGKFERGDDGLWRNPRLEAERQKQSERRAALAANGHLGGRPRKQKETNRFSVANLNESLPSPSSSAEVLSDRSQREPAHDHPTRAGNFCEWYRETHDRLLGVGYIGNPRKDYEKALELVAAFGDQELRDAAIIWFGQRDAFAVNGTRTVTKFASRATVLVVQAREVAS